ncbi:metallopeptidase family M24 [Apiospora hydei]|uniref:Xaa-Pro aminopeptidase n=1 Tax=Apiospora hydei TaxID=1337664 RepID=A0ABR1WNI3_9PEZI
MLVTSFLPQNEAHKVAEPVMAPTWLASQATCFKPPVLPSCRACCAAAATSDTVSDLFGPVETETPVIPPLAVHETHPHILAPGELTPGITAQEYHDRRARLIASLPPNSAVLLPSAEIQFKSGAVFHAFRQETAFLYLTGFCEPESLALLVKTNNDYIFHLWCRPKNPKQEQWYGPWSGVDAARDVWNADEAGDIGRIEFELGNALKDVSKIYTDAELTKYGVATKLGNTLRSAAPNAGFAPLRPALNPLRAIKSPAEVACMRRAGQASGRALTNAMRQSWKFEKDLASFLEYEYHKAGLEGSAYIPVVAGGQKALLIHYVMNNGHLNEDEFVLVDAGGEYGTYITDITRTWPVSGKFSPAQKDLYEAVLSAQRQSIGLCYSRGTTLREGHCITIEPGVYVPDDDRWPEAFRGMGIRIEDSVMVGEEHPYVLTTEAVKEVVDIEALRDR